LSLLYGRLIPDRQYQPFCQRCRDIGAAQARHKAVISGSIERTLHESELLLTTFIQSAPFRKRFGADEFDHKSKGLTYEHWLVLPKYDVMFLLALRAGKWTPPIPPPEVKLKEKRSPTTFPAGGLKEDASPGRTKTEALNKRNLKRPAHDQELPEETPRHRKKGLKVRVTVTKTWVLPQFTTMDALGQTVSNDIVEFDDERRDTIEYVADNFARHDDSSHRQAVRHNALVMVFAARWDLYLLGCTRAIQDSYIQQARARVGKFHAVL